MKANWSQTWPVWVSTVSPWARLSRNPSGAKTHAKTVNSPFRTAILDTHPIRTTLLAWNLKLSSSVMLKLPIFSHTLHGACVVLIHIIHYSLQHQFSSNSQVFASMGTDLSLSFLIAFLGAVTIWRGKKPYLKSLTTTTYNYSQGYISKSAFWTELIG